MHKITLYTECTDKPDWLYLRNEIYTSAYAGVDPKYCDASLASIAGAYRSILKANMRIMLATFEAVDQFGQAQLGGETFATAFSTFGKHGQRPIAGAMFYRDIFRVAQYPISGRVGHLWFRGVLDSSEIATDAQIGRVCAVAPGLLGSLQDASAGYGCPLFNNMLLLQSDRGLTASLGETSYYSDSHAATRWRRRTHGKLVDTARLLIPAIEAMAVALENSRYWQSVSVRISPGATYQNLVSAIQSAELIHNAVKQARQAGRAADDQNATEPKLRFGPTWDAIIEAWASAEQQGKKPLEALQKKYPPHNESGDQYIDTDFLSNYNELLEKILGTVALTANADWFNPRAYKGQLAASEMKRLPDIIELAF